MNVKIRHCYLNFLSIGSQSSKNIYFGFYNYLSLQFKLKLFQRMFVRSYFDEPSFTFAKGNKDKKEHNIT